MFIRHYVIEMDASKVQHCIFCGEVIADLRNVSFEGNVEPKGYPEGDVFVSEGNPSVYLTHPAKNLVFENCI